MFESSCWRSRQLSKAICSREFWWCLTKGPTRSLQVSRALASRDEQAEASRPRLSGLHGCGDSGGWLHGSRNAGARSLIQMFWIRTIRE